MKKNNKKGFTLAELLIVVAIIAVLVAIAIPVFTTQLEKSREATDIANVRSAYAGVVTDYLTDTANYASISAVVQAQQKVTSWQTSSHHIMQMNGATMTSTEIPEGGAKAGGSWTIKINESGSVTIS